MGKNEGRMDQDQERRKGADLRIKLAKGAGIVSWLFFIALLIAIQIAKPQFETIFDRFYRITLRTTWDLALAKYLYHLMIAGLVFSCIGLVARYKRGRRRTDGLPLALLFIGFFSLVGVILYMIYLG